VKIVLGGLIGLMLVGFCLLGGGLAVVLRPEGTLEGPCRSFLDRPKERWVKLSGCRLQIDELLVANDDAVERFADRAEGVSRTLYATPPVWTHAWAPLSTGSPDDHRAVRAVVRLVDADVLKWVNAVERADEAQRKRLLENQAVLLRVAMPGLLMGHASRPPEADLLQAALGTTAQAGLLVIEPGPPPPVEWPVPALLAGFVGFAVLLLTLARLVRRTPAEAAAADVTGIDVSDVKLSIGELEEVRREQAEARKTKRPPS
jgi:hypothetical protein